MVSKKPGYWIGGTLVFFSLAALYVAGALFLPRHYPCNLPSLESAIPATVLSEVGTVGYFSHTCPVPIAEELAFERDYGELRMLWWGSSSLHRLYMAGASTAGRPLRIEGRRVEAYEASRPDSRLSGYASRATLSRGNNIPPMPMQFTITVLDDSELLEEIELRYAPQRCTCALYDGL
jgi:hypothetical protein